MRPVLTTACFPQDTFDGTLLARLLSELDFQASPRQMRYRTDTWVKKPFTSRNLEALAGEVEVSSLTVEAGHDEEFSFTRVAKWRADIVNWESKELVDVGPFLRYPAFRVCSQGSAEDVFWQSADLVSTYRQFGMPIDPLKVIKGGPPNLQKVDVSSNPGRRIALPGLVFWIAAGLWFGPGAFARLDRHKVQTFPGALTSDDSTLALQLYGLSDTESRIRQIQSTFYEWCSLDDVIQRAALDTELEDGDPSIEIISGVSITSPRTVIEYLSEDGKRARRRSQARLMRVSSISASGDISVRLEEVS